MDALTGEESARNIAMTSLLDLAELPSPINAGAAAGGAPSPSQTLREISHRQQHGLRGDINAVIAMLELMQAPSSSHLLREIAHCPQEGFRGDINAVIALLELMHAGGPAGVEAALVGSASSSSSSSSSRTSTRTAWTLRVPVPAATFAEVDEGATLTWRASPSSNTRPATIPPAATSQQLIAKAATGAAGLKVMPPPQSRKPRVAIQSTEARGEIASGDRVRWSRRTTVRRPLNKNQPARVPLRNAQEAAGGTWHGEGASGDGGGGGAAQR